MKIWKDGERSRAICPRCERRTGIQFGRRTVELSAPAVKAEDVLVGVCLECDGIAVIPRQSTPRLKEAVERPMQVLNVRVPGHLIDIIELLADRWDLSSRSRTPSVMRLLLSEFANDPAYARRVRDLVGHELAGGPADHDLSVRVPAHTLLGVDQMMELTGVQNRSEVVRGVLVAAKDEVLDERNPELEVVMRRALTAIG